MKTHPLIACFALALSVACGVAVALGGIELQAGGWSPDPALAGFAAFTA